MRFLRAVLFCMTALLGAASQAVAFEPLLVAFPQGIFVPASALGDRVSITVDGVLVRVENTFQAVAADGAVPGSECRVAVEKAYGEWFLSREGVTCLGWSVHGASPALLPIPGPPLLDFGMPPAKNAVRIVIDPGHGGRDHGATGVSNAVEKEISLAIARRLRDVIATQPGFEVFLTREEDRYLTLRERAEFANRINADLFVSIHCNSGRRIAARGVEVFIPGRRAHDEATRLLAELENAGEVEVFSVAGGVDGLLGDLALADQLQHSARAADRLLSNMTTELELENRGVKQAPFWVLLGSNMPAVLVETGFVTNPDEGVLLSQASYQDLLASAMARALTDVQPLLLSRRRNIDAENKRTRGAGAAAAQVDSQLAPQR
jgi:N-acetylmuramoyl-L-alanine amidase